MQGLYDMDEAIRRCQGFAAAGATCVYVPVPPSMAELARLVAAVDVPVNALVAGAASREPLAAFAQIGVARLSLGSSLARVTHRVMKDAADAMFGRGDFMPLTQGISSTVIDGLLSQGARQKV
jgi:2-methylisocitrate lyase-like PEP mutase family enzyme